MCFDRFVVVVVAIAGFAFPAAAKFEVKIESLTSAENNSASANHTCDSFPSDAFTLRASDEGKPLATIEYCAAYGNASAEGFTDKSGRFYALIERETTRGTHATFYDLDVYRVMPGYYFKIMSFPVEEPAGMCHEVKYSYIAANSRRGGLKLTLRRQIQKDSETCPDQLEMAIPPDVVREINFDADP